MTSPPNAQYSSIPHGSPLERLTVHMRRKMYRAFLAACAPPPDATLLDVGVTSERDYTFSNYLEAWYPHPERITAVGLQNAAFLEADYPGLRFVQANGLALPFADGSFDFAHSSAVLEHVGSRANQGQFIAELLRVSRQGVFLTTPNRWFPVEFHTVLPLVHWLPMPWFRALLRMLGQEAMAREENLNLLGRRELRALCASLPGADCEVRHVSLLGWPSNLLCVVRKRA